MARPLQIQTDNAAAKKAALSEGAGIPVAVTISTQQLVHVVPEGYRDELHLWWNNTDAAADGAILIEFNGDANLSIIEIAPFRETIKPINGMVIEAQSGDVDVDALALTEPGILWGYALRTAIEP